VTLRVRTLRLAAPAALVVGLAGCGASSEAGTEGPLVVLAAASLTGAFTELAASFEADNPGTTVTLSFAASSALAQQVLSGAPADVFAAASPATMETVTGAGEAAEPEVFARNTLQIAVPAGNPADVTGLADFADEDLAIALCAEQVPCGAAARRVFEASGVVPSPDTLEQDVKAALSKVTLGEVDAALVYRTDVLAAGDEVEGIAFPEAQEAVNDYPLVVLGTRPTRVRRRRSSTTSCPRRGSGSLSRPGSTVPDTGPEDGRPVLRHPPAAGPLRRVAPGCPPCCGSRPGSPSPSSSCRSSRWSCAPRGAPCPTCC
jgi:molybdate transport system substrate-binding protein